MAVCNDNVESVSIFSPHHTHERLHCLFKQFKNPKGTREGVREREKRKERQRKDQGKIIGRGGKNNGCDQK